MAFSEESGSQTTSGTTEHVLNTTNPETTDCILSILIDTDDMVAGDVLEIRVYEKVRDSSGTQQVLLCATLPGEQSADDLIWAVFGLHMLHGWKVTVKATAGTITLPWSLRKIT